MDTKHTSEKLAKELCAVRKKKIDQLKTRIESGQYKVKNKEIIKALLFAG